MYIEGAALSLLIRWIVQQKYLHWNRCSYVNTLLFLGLLILQLIAPVSFADGPTTHEVDGDGGADFITIQDAINASEDGDIIYIHEGIYNEHIVIDKDITVQGENQDLVIIDGDRSGDTVTIDHDYVTLQMLTLRNAYHGIDIYSSFVSVTSLTIDDMAKGIVLEGATYTSISSSIISNCSSMMGCWIKSSSHNTTIINNDFRDSDTAISISNSNEQRITQNSIKDCRFGILFFSSTQNTITSNTISTTFFGVVFSRSSFNTVQSNSFLHQGMILLGSDVFSDLPVYYTSHTIEDNTLDGNPIYYYSQQQDMEVPTNAAQVILADCQNMLIQDHEYLQTNNPIQIAFSSDCTIANTHIDTSNDSGIIIAFSSRIHLVGSTIMECQGYSLMIVLCSDTTIIHNNFIDNTHHVFIDEGGIWDDGYPYGGNYWSDYTGSDADDDGIGDIPYEIIEGVQDEYPFMQPSGWETFAVNINAPDQVNESSSFEVSVLVQDAPLPNATISFAGQQYITSTQGSTTVTSPSVSSDQTYELQVEKFGYPSASTTILVQDTSPPPSQQDQLNLVAPESVIEENQFLVTVTSNGQPVANVQISFNSQTVYTSVDGTVTLQAPDVDEDTVFTVQAAKAGYLPDETTVIVRILNSTITLHSPDGGDSIHDVTLVTWGVSSTGALDHHAISLYYQYHNGLWVVFAEDLSVLSSSYSWNTKMMPDGHPYLVKVVLKKDTDTDGVYETVVAEDSSDTAFAIDNSLGHIGWLTGSVIHQQDNFPLPIEGVSVCIILSTQNNIITSKCAFTNEQGDYSLDIQTGSYTVVVAHPLYETVTINEVMIWANESTVLNCTLEPGEPSTTYFFLQENRKSINDAIKQKTVGAEFSIQKKDDTYEHQILVYDSVSITPATLENNQIVLTINGDEHAGGKTIVINLHEHFIKESNSLVITYDGQPLALADNISDVLNPNDDGLHAEYLLTKGAQGWQILVSIPHFSKHLLSIQPTMIQEIITTPLALVTYLIVVLVITLVANKHLRKLWKS